jgi:adenylate cyclase
VRRQLEQILSNADFDASRRSREFLVFIVEEAIAGRGESLTQAAIATRVFDRRDDFDPVVDPIVRIQAGRLRRSLERYYLLSGKQDPLRIELPRGCYVPAFRDVPAPEAAPATRPEAAPAAQTEDWPAIVVSALEPAGPSPEDKALAHLVTEELILELGRYRDFRTLLRVQLEGLAPPVLNRQRFWLDGRLRLDDQGPMVVARLVDHATGEQVWGDTYHTQPKNGRWSGSPEDVARVVAARIAAEEGVLVQLLGSERRRMSPRPRTPFDAMLLAYEFFLARTPESLSASVTALQRAVEADPDCGPAWTRLARVFLNNHTFEVTSLPTPLEQAIAYAHHGVRLDPASRRARCVLAASLIAQGELLAARAELDEALRVSPDSLVYLEIIGFLLTVAGDWERGPAFSRSARERNPHALTHGLFGLWADHLRRGEFEAAYQAALEYRDPTVFWRSAMRACCLGHLGRPADAEVADLLRGKPDFEARGRTLIGYFVKFPELMDVVVDGLARAGVRLA